MKLLDYQLILNIKSYPKSIKRPKTVDMIIWREYDLVHRR
jgi:hypothetical protein